jgi:hypothetical protein
VTEIQKLDLADSMNDSDEEYPNGWTTYHEIVYNNNVGCYSLGHHGDGTASFGIIAWLSTPVPSDGFTTLVDPSLPHPDIELEIEVPKEYNTMAEVYSLFCKFVDSKGKLDDYGE